jgi:trk system potassium uptake protein TrkH
VKSTLFNRPRVVMFERTLSNLVVVRSIALFMMSLVLVSITALVLMKIESDKSFLALLFEIVSAFGTVGLSLGITPALTAMGKIVICLVMYIGRVGPLTLILAIADRSESNQSLKFPESKVLIG